MIPTEYTWPTYYKKFKLAKKEDTLDTMYNGAVKRNKASELSKELIKAIDIEIHFAYSRRQDDFDALKDKSSSPQVIENSVQRSLKDLAHLTPEQQLSQMLNQL
ncbi:conserved hypothetical protein [Vibrio chagasii]|nr:conserved hypothetical protein [Vibrio chagasii]